MLCGILSSIGRTSIGLVDGLALSDPLLPRVIIQTNTADFNLQLCGCFSSREIQWEALHKVGILEWPKAEKSKVVEKFVATGLVLDNLSTLVVESGYGYLRSLG